MEREGIEWNIWFNKKKLDLNFLFWVEQQKKKKRKTSLCTVMAGS